MPLRGDHPDQRDPPPDQRGRVLLQPEHLHPEAVRFLLREVARRLSGIPRPLQILHTLVQRVRHPLQSIDPPIGRLVRPHEHPADPRRDARERRAEQLGGEWGEVEVVHEASMRGHESDDTHANGAYIIGMTRFPAPPAGMFETTVLFGHTSTVAPSDVPSVFRSG